MKQVWTQEELVEHWTLGASELVLLMNKSGIGRLGFALLLKFFQMEGRFPANKNEVPQSVIEYVARQTEVAPTSWAEYGWQSRTIKVRGTLEGRAVARRTRLDYTSCATAR